MIIKANNHLKIFKKRDEDFSRSPQKISSFYLKDVPDEIYIEMFELQSGSFGYVLKLNEFQLSFKELGLANIYLEKISKNEIDNIETDHPELFL